MTISIHGITDAPLDIPTRAIVAGPSGSGKTRILHAIAGAVADCGADGGKYPTHLIPDRGEVRVTSGDRTLYHRTPSRRVTGPTADPDRAVILSPSLLIDLLTSTAPSAATAAAAHLDRIIPGPSAADLIDAFVRAGEPLTAKDAETYRRDANRDLQHAEGVHAEAKRAAERAAADLASLEVPDPAKVAAARAYLDRVETDRAALAAWQQADRAHRDSRATLAAWQARADRIRQPEVARPESIPDVLPDPGPTPTRPEPTTGQPRYALDRIERQRPNPPRLAAIPEAPACAGLTGCTLAAGRAALERANADAAAEHAREVKSWGYAVEEAKAALAAAEAVDRAANDAYAAAAKTHAEALAAWQASRAAHDAAARARDAWTSYDTASAALGDAPVILPDPGPAPVVEDAHADRARARIAQAERYEVESATLRQRADAASSRAADTYAAAAAAARRQARAEEVLSYIRGAPAEALRGKLAALTLPDRIRVSVSDAGDLAVTLDSRPLGCASTGERVWASAILRAALRATRPDLADVPILVDGAQDWSGNLVADISGPLVLAVTKPGILGVSDLAAVVADDEPPRTIPVDEVPF
jgi:energy-coupling factor transporter ATP-binding protein EcfA2